MATAPLSYPAVPRGDVVDTFHGVSVADPYRALEEDSPATAQFVADQQALFASYAAQPAFAGLRPKLRATMEKQYNYERVGLPSLRGGNVFFFRNTGLQNQDVLFKAPAAAQPGAFSELAAPEALLDLNAEFPAGTTSLSTYSANKAGTLLAYALAHGAFGSLARAPRRLNGSPCAASPLTPRSTHSFRPAPRCRRL